MQDRFRLRFETGERQGEVVVLTGPRVTLGRRPGNTIQIADASVSSLHAEFAVDASGVSLKDLGSTNGTRVGAQSLDGSARLAHGDELTFGNVRARFVDQQIASGPVPADAARVGTADAQLAGGNVHEVSAERLERAEKRSVASLVGLALLFGVGGAAAWYLTRDSGSSGGLGRPIVSAPGNLLAASYSFETGGDQDDPDTEGRADHGWEGDPGATTSFFATEVAAYSGTLGLAAVLAEDEWALHRSPEVRVDSGTSMEAAARFQTVASGRARLGIEFASSTDAVTPFAIWGDSRTGADFADVFAASMTPPGYDLARVLVFAESTSAEGGEVRVDDVSFVPAAGAGRAETPAIGEYQIHTLGEARGVLLLFKISRALASGIRVFESLTGPIAPGQRGATERRAHLEVTPRDAVFHVAGSGLGGNAVLEAFVEAQAAGNLATLGANGYRKQLASFEEEGVQSCLFGQGNDLVRLVFQEPLRVTGRAVGGGFLLTAELGGAGEQRFGVQVSFSAERSMAAGLAEQAREAERSERLGEATRSWQELLSEFPFEEELVREAGQSHAELIRAGLEELATVRADVDRAGFFRLPNLYRSARVKAVDIADKFSGSVVEEQASSLIATIDGLIVELERSLYAREVERLGEIRTLLEAAQMPQLSARVAAYMEARFGADDRGDH